MTTLPFRIYHAEKEGIGVRAALKQLISRWEEEIA